jgi:hypothetical protein
MSTATAPSRTIVAARLDTTSEPRRLMVTFDDSPEEKFFYQFFSDEKSYDPQSFVGMTEAAADKRVLDDDTKYMRSPQRFMAF